MWWVYLPVLLLALSTASVNAVQTVILENTEGLPPGWAFHSKADVSETITLSVILKEPGIEELKRKMAQRYSDRGQLDAGSGHLSGREVSQLRRPVQKAVESVSSWLRSSGVRGLQIRGSVLSFSVSVGVARSLFEANIARYSYGDEKPVLRALSYTVPRWLRQDIDFVHPIANFIIPRHRGGRKKPVPKPPQKPAPKPPKSNAPMTSETPPQASPSLVPDPPFNGEENPQEPDFPCLTSTYPECIRQLYNITYNQTSPSPVRFGVAGFLEQWIHYQDVSKFLRDLAPELAVLNPPHNFTVELFNGGVNPQSEPPMSGIEAALDVEYAMAIGYPTNVVYYVTGGRGTKLGANGTALPVEQADNEPYFEFLEALLAKPDGELPHVLSISYADDEIGVPRAYAHRVCDQFAALSARGVSVLVATGDGGAAGTGQTRCVSNDGFGRRMFMPTFPASCPYVTSVGATLNVAPPLSGAHFSSGGFSNHFGRPTWQRKVVDPYVNRMVEANDERLSLFNWTGRAMPDISAIGSGFQVVQNGNLGAVMGTSASTPVVAAMVALVNDARLRAGKSSLGWLNPILYDERTQRVLRDVVTGQSNGCSFPDGTNAPGWRAAKGYDCVTGLGTVGDFNAFLRALT
ncbi:hypothetical protein OQA88_9540 [Cercophora sp. LCS_1]